MPLRISCPEGHTLVVSQARAGSTLRCPKCSARIVVPSAPPPPTGNASLIDVAMSAAAEEPQQPQLATVIVSEPVPPPIVAPPVEVAPPPVWSPPPKSRAIVETPVEMGPEPPPAETIEPPKPAAAVSPEAEKAHDVSPEVPAVPQPPAEIDPHRISVAATAENQHLPEVPASAADPVQELPRPTPVATFHAEPSPPAAAASELPPPLVPSEGRKVSAWLLAASLAAAALFGAAPAIWDLVQFAQAAENAFVPRWALALIAVGIVQGAYALYLGQLPDWMSGWIVTLVSLALAALYAGMLGVTLLASAESSLLQELDLAETVLSGRAAMWCLCMTSILASLAFFAGRTSIRWRIEEKTQPGLSR